MRRTVTSLRTSAGRLWRYWSRPVAVGLTVVLSAMVAYRLVAVATSPFGRTWTMANGDLVGYLDGARRFIETGSPYLSEQVAGPWGLGPHSFVHPPSALPLMVPFLVLPAILWWAIPLALTAYCIARLRPGPWAWPVLALCLLWPRSTGAILAGNTDLWVMALVAAGTVWGWPLALLALKPTWAPIAALHARDLRLWALVLLLVLPFTGMWLDYVDVVRNAGLSPAYSLGGLPLVLMPVAAWCARSRLRSRSGATARALPPDREVLTTRLSVRSAEIAPPA